MRRVQGFVWAALIAAPGLVAVTPSAASHGQGFGIELWTDRGNDAVYQPGQAMRVRARVSDDASLLVYEIDAEGAVRALFPERGSSGFVEGQRTYSIPPEGADVELVVKGPVGQGYIVAIASREAFRDLPWFLRPYDPQAEDVGYEGRSGEEEEGVTAEGRVVGDPFGAMERIRRRVLAHPDASSSFASAYTSYYVHHEVRYPRYLCYDCHRPHRWAWWDGYDPYYTTCSVFDFRVNWGWYWGPGYWLGSVPYYYYVYRPDCPPRYRILASPRPCYSSWDGWGRWRTLWGSRLTRYKSDPPSGYVPPSKFWNGGVWGDDKPAPPGFLVRGDGERVRHRLAAFVPIGRDEPRRGGGVGDASGSRDPRPALGSGPGRGDRPWIDRRGERPGPDRGDRPSIGRGGEPPAHREGHPRLERTPEPEDRSTPPHHVGRESRPEPSLGRSAPAPPERPNAERRRHEEPKADRSREEPRREGSRRGEGGRSG